MSTGNKIVPIRLDEKTLRAIDDAIASPRACRDCEPDTVSSWIRKAIAEKLDHRVRSRKKKTSVQLDVVVKPGEDVPLEK